MFLRQSRYYVQQKEWSREGERVLFESYTLIMVRRNWSYCWLLLMFAAAAAVAFYSSRNIENTQRVGIGKN